MRADAFSFHIASDHDDDAADDGSDTLITVSFTVLRATLQSWMCMRTDTISVHFTNGHDDDNVGDGGGV